MMLRLEIERVESELGQRVRDAILAEAVEIVEADGRKLDAVGFSTGNFALLLPDTSSRLGAPIKPVR